MGRAGVPSCFFACSTCDGCTGKDAVDNIQADAATSANRVVPVAIIIRS